jgi:hypothetical protein
MRRVVYIHNIHNIQVQLCNRLLFRVFGFVGVGVGVYRFVSSLVGVRRGEVV